MLSDVAIAIALVYLPDEERTLHAEFRSGDGDFSVENPILHAEAFKQSCKDDFPNGIWAVTGNQAAKDLMVAARMRALGFDDE